MFSMLANNIWPWFSKLCYVSDKCHHKRISTQLVEALDHKPGIVYIQKEIGKQTLLILSVYKKPSHVQFSQTNPKETLIVVRYNPTHPNPNFQNF